MPGCFVHSLRRAPAAPGLPFGYPAGMPVRSSPPLTLNAVARLGGRLLIGCGCGTNVWQSAADYCPPLRAWTVEEMERAGIWSCGCGQRPAVMVYAPHGTGQYQLERWRGPEGWTRPA